MTTGLHFNQRSQYEKIGHTQNLQLVQSHRRGAEMAAQNVLSGGAAAEGWELSGFASPAWSLPDTPSLSVTL